MSYDDSHLRRVAREALEKGETERQGPRLWVILSGAIAAALIAFAAVVIVRGLDIIGGDGGDAPLITAEAGPGKVRPEDSGGLEVSDQDKFVYDRIASNEAPEELEQLLPPAEPAVAGPTVENEHVIDPALDALEAAREAAREALANAAALSADDATAEITAVDAAPGVPPEVEAPAIEAIATAREEAASLFSILVEAVPDKMPAADQPGPATENRHVIDPALDALEAAREATREALANATARSADDVTAEITAVDAAPGVPPEVEAPAIEATATASEEAASLPSVLVEAVPDEMPAADQSGPSESTLDRVANIAPAAGTATGTPFLIQIGAFRSAENADNAGIKLKKVHRDLLEAFALDIQRADLGAEKGVFYRTRLGPMGEVDAKELCNRLKERNVDCLIIRG